MGLFDFLKKKKKAVRTVSDVNWKKPMVNKFIYSEIVWDNVTKIYTINRYNNYNNTHDSFPLKEVATHSYSPNGLRTPLILPEVYWPFLLKKMYTLKSFRIEFSNYSTKIDNYTVLMTAIQLSGKQVVDGFSSTTLTFVGPQVLVENIDAFLSFAEKYK
jgi:hypothetical protein